MSIPGWRDWAFALRTFAAAMAALYVALWIELPRPYWAVGTVYITSQILSGATSAKAMFRLGGTLLGAIAAIVLVPNLVNAPLLLSLAIALWVACCLYVALLDRTPASYLPMLAGYTTAIVGFPAVSDPGAIFDTAVARAEEISLGIICATLAATLVLPQSAQPQIAARLDAWVAEARAWMRESLMAGPDADRQVARLRLASDAIAFDAMELTLRSERSGAERAGPALHALRQHMLMFLPIVTAVADRVGALTAAAAMPRELRELLSDLSAWLESTSQDVDEASGLRSRIAAAAPSLGSHSDWNTLLLASLVARLHDVVDLRQDIRQLRRHILDGTPMRAPLAFRYTARAREVRYRDHELAAYSALGAVLAILVACAIWIGTGWSAGAIAPMMAAVTCCLFAAQDDPAPAILGFANSALIGSIGAGIVLFGILPVVTTFEMLVLSLAPALILCGLMMTQPRIAAIGMGAAVNGATLLALQNGYNGNFADFANSVIALLIGMWLAALVIRLVRSVGADWSARRLARLNRESVAQAAERRGGGQGLELAALMLDRVGLIAPRLEALPPDDAERLGDLLAEVRVGINLVEIRRERRALPEAAREAVGRTLAAVARYVRMETSETPATADAEIELVAAIDSGLDAVLDALPGPEAHGTALGLTGLRRALIPHADAYNRTQAEYRETAA